MNVKYFVITCLLAKELEARRPTLLLTKELEDSSLARRPTLLLTKELEPSVQTLTYERA
jgi:hypothetical protein